MNYEDIDLLEVFQKKIFPIVKNQWYDFHDFNLIVLYQMKSAGYPIKSGNIQAVMNLIIESGLVEGQDKFKKIKFRDYCYEQSGL